MFLLRTLGALELEQHGRPVPEGLASQPKRAGLLVYLALARPTGYVRRDTLVALLWPDQDSSAARQSLRQAVYKVRQLTGRNLVLSRGDEELGLDGSRIDCDARHFEELVHAGDLVGALRLYQGDFLEGFHIPNAAHEIEEWIAGERTRLRELAASAARRLSSKASSQGDLTRALPLARRAQELMPDDEQTAHQYVALLLRTGDRAGALRAGQAFVERLRHELGASPSPQFRGLLERARRTPPPSSTVGT